jgi:hypothetical protein
MFNKDFFFGIFNSSGREQRGVKLCSELFLVVFILEIFGVLGSFSLKLSGCSQN